MRWCRPGRGDAAISSYEEALKLQPDDSGAARNLGIALLAAGRVSEANRAVRSRVAQRIPLDATAHSNLGYAFWQIGQVEMAVVHFETAARLEPDSAEAHYSYARALARARRFADAIGEYRRVIALKPASCCGALQHGERICADRAVAAGCRSIRRGVEIQARVSRKPTTTSVRFCAVWAVLRKLVGTMVWHFATNLTIPGAAQPLQPWVGSQDVPSIQE